MLRSHEAERVVRRQPLDAVDGTPEDVVYVESDGTVSIGQTMNPTLRIHSTGDGEPDLWLVREGWGNYDYRLINDNGTMKSELSLNDGATWSLMHHFGHDGSASSIG